MRVLKLSEFLNENEYQVFVLSARGDEIVDYFGYERVLEKFSCTYIYDELTNRACRSWNQSQLSKDKLSNIKSEKSIQSLLFSWAKNIIHEISVPDINRYFINKYLRKAIKLIEINNIRDVIISSPSHSMQLIGPELKKRFNGQIKLIVDYRDSWNTTGIFKKKLKPFQKFNESLEKNVLKSADYFTYVSQPMLDKIAKKYGDFIKNKAHLIMNGFDDSMIIRKVNVNPSTFDKDNNTICMGYFGGIGSEWRDPSNFVKALKEVLNENKKDLKVKLYFYGSIPANIKQFIYKELEERVEFNEGIGHTDALRIMHRMDYLLIFHSKIDGADEVITGKFFEYLAVRKPIIVIGPNNMEAAKLTEENNLGIIMDITNHQNMCDKLRPILKKEIDTTQFYKGFNINKYSRQFQYKKFLEILSSDK